MEFELTKHPLVFENEGQKIVMKAGKDTNLFNGMMSGYKTNNFPFYFTTWEGDFCIRCKVTPEFGSLYDLGSIVAYATQNKWIKMAFEQSDAGHPAIVSIVTNESSDDCNGEMIQSESVWIQLLRKKDAFAMHYSLDKQEWKLARIFGLAMPSKIKLGISPQCPMGEECTVIFEDLEITDNPFENIRTLK